MRSSVIASHSYDQESGELTITFTTGRIYLYRGVPADVAAAFDIALSQACWLIRASATISAAGSRTRSRARRFGNRRP